MIDTKSQLALPYLFKKKRIKALPQIGNATSILHWMLKSVWIALASSESFDCPFSYASTTLCTLYRPSLSDRPGRTSLSLFFRNISVSPMMSSTWIWGSVWWVLQKKKKNPPYWDFDWDCHWTYINLKRMKFSGYWIFPLLNVTFLSINCEDLLCFSERIYDIQHLNPLLIFC